MGPTHGLYYRVSCSRDIHWVFQRNIQFMENYFRGDWQVPPGIHDVVTAHVNASPGLSLDQLLRSTAHAASADDIFSLIAAGGVYIDLRKARHWPNQSTSPYSRTRGHPPCSRRKTTSASPTRDCDMCPARCAEKS